MKDGNPHHNGTGHDHRVVNRFAHACRDVTHALSIANPQTDDEHLTRAMQYAIDSHENALALVELLGAITQGFIVNLISAGHDPLVALNATRADLIRGRLAALKERESPS